MHIRIATRKSLLALWQAEYVAAEINRTVPSATVELVPLSTRGDEVLDRSLQKIGGKGLFIKELEVAMQDGRADIAVHSMKDVPAVMPEGFCIAAILPRGNPADALLGREAVTLKTLPEGAVVGSSSLRRQAQILAVRPDLCVKPLRGNVQTRIGKLDAGEYDAIVLAAAGLERLELADRISEVLPATTMLPAAGQGVIGIECLSDRDDLCSLLARLEDPVTAVTTRAERAVAHRLEASCHSPVASYAILNGDELTLEALVARADGSEVLRQQSSGRAADAAELGTALADVLLANGAANLLAGS
ncbi:hydroxymethylbilane synthase [Woeseia oceani]|uniref:Porphobilinogen deaminase n=1 Tax=Woeseia oceani TaxID=1548547 RepID=A0A193LBW6_9GAMM|nr:hydroxymethylbilane synthase [Woeseia oceani]ANO49963.1 hydroxymethylbilane synthase [Woeseia oceani]